MLKTETDSRDSHGGQARIKAARFPARKTLEEFDFAFQTASIAQTRVLHLGQLDFLAGKENVVLLGPPGTGKTTSRSRSGSAPASPATASRSGPRPNGSRCSADAQRQGRLDAELEQLQRIPLLIVDEVGYIPFDPQAANLMFMLVSRRYERASLIVTSNKPFSAWGEIFGDDVTAAAMIDRLVHHAEILALKGDSYRLKDRDLARHRRRPPHLTDQRARRERRACSRLALRARLRAARRRPTAASAHTSTKGGQFSPGATGSLFERP